MAIDFNKMKQKLNALQGTAMETQPKTHFGNHKTEIKRFALFVPKMAIRSSNITFTTM